MESPVLRAFSLYDRKFYAGSGQEGDHGGAGIFGPGGEGVGEEALRVHGDLWEPTALDLDHQSVPGQEMMGQIIEGQIDIYLFSWLNRYHPVTTFAEPCRKDAHA